MKILVIDDAVFKREQITDFLSSKNINFETCEYLNQALKFICGNKWDISGIILDLGLQCSKDLPETYSLLRGMNVVYELQRKGIDIPILINSSTKVERIKDYSSIYGQRTQIDNDQILEDFINFLSQREKQ